MTPDPNRVRRDILPSLVGLQGGMASGCPIGVPFRNVSERRSELLPFRQFLVAVGSNGMCSGNTPWEAMVHGLSEVFERHILKQMFLNPFTPPDIPLACFEGHDVHDKLCKFARDHLYTIHVKDCSLASGFPVVGLLIRDPRGRYAFHLGADPSPVTALERCVTESWQGGALVFLDPAAIPADPCRLESSPFWRTQLHLNIRSYEGQWPPALLEATPDYQFTGFPHPVSKSDEDDLAYLLSIVRSAGWELLVRDNTLQDIPGFHVYVPGISEMANVADNRFIDAYLHFEEHLPALTRLTATSRSQREALVAAIERYAHVAPTGSFVPSEYFGFYANHPVARLDQAGLVDLLHRGSRHSVWDALPHCFSCVACSHRDRCDYGTVERLCAAIRHHTETDISWSQWMDDPIGNFPPMPMTEQHPA